MERDNKFFEYQELVNYLKDDLKELFCENLLQELIEKNLLISFNKDEKSYFYYKDIEICKKLLIWNTTHTQYDYDFVGYDGDIFFEILKIAEGTYLRYVKKNKCVKKVPAYVRNILYFFIDKYEKSEEIQFELLDTFIVTDNKFVISYITNATYRMYCLENTKLSNFTNSSTYMGIKKDIKGFLVESIWPHCEDNSVLIDLMCGSGSASNAFAQISDVYASDAQKFCSLLAQVQGKGFNIGLAEKLQNEVYRHYLNNLNQLHRRFSEDLKKENEVFHMDSENGEIVFNAYSKFVEEFPLYSTTEATVEKVLIEIANRRNNSNEYPYCLFTYYFSNIYFGLEQCIQIDSIRYAVDQIEDEKSREWLLGILVIAVSVVASNYGGHFAQPKKVDEKSIKKIIEKRKKSVWLEFSKRLVVIAAESEKYNHEIHMIEGPWENALMKLKEKQLENMVVYLDAPYKREEYSRYYHVLETLVRYDYPSSENKGRVRSIQNGERFRSNFCSRNIKAVELYFVSVITKILENAYICAWSYSTNGAVDIMNVVDSVKKIMDCDVYIYSTVHKHVSQGKRKVEREIKQNVIEYCIIFKRRLKM